MLPAGHTQAARDFVAAFDGDAAALARLPRLREVHLDALPGVTLEGTRVFPPGVQVHDSA